MKYVRVCMSPKNVIETDLGLLEASNVDTEIARSGGAGLISPQISHEN